MSGSVANTLNAARAEVKIDQKAPVADFSSLIGADLDRAIEDQFNKIRARQLWAKTVAANKDFTANDRGKRFKHKYRVLPRLFKP